MSKPPESDDDWRVEYDQLSEDFRHYVAMGWQATVAVLVADGVVIGFSANLANAFLFAIVCAIAATLTFFMAIANWKWTKRGKKRACRLEELDKMHDFSRFYPPEKGWLSKSVGYWMFGLLLGVTGILAVLTIMTVIVPDVIFNCIAQSNTVGGMEYSKVCR